MVQESSNIEEKLIAGARASYWCYTDGFKEGNNFGLSHCNDLHVGWRILCEGMHRSYKKITFINNYGDTDANSGRKNVDATIYNFIILQDVPVFISWLRYLSFNYHTYKLLLKVQYEHISNSINGVRIDSGYKEVGALTAMVVGYRLLAYISLRRMKLQPGA